MKGTPRPFVKWAGGKTRAIASISEYLPPGIASGKITKYVEPMVGGGALFFYLSNNSGISKFYISDLNKRLIFAYKTIKNRGEDLVEMLSSVEAIYLSKSSSERESYYYNIRKRYNINYSEIKNYEYLDSSDIILHSVAHLLFLNKVCFNGLFRVNKQGEFNSPFGKYKKPKICDAENIGLVSTLLAKTHIEFGDYTLADVFIDSSTFVYLDPPYRPLSKQNNFTAYNSEKFDDMEQLRLRDFYRSIDGKGAKVMLSNSDPKNADIKDKFFDIAYKGYNINCIKNQRNINSKGSGRGEINELLITNY
jgi:DNA adenine methylase